MMTSTLIVLIILLINILSIIFIFKKPKYCKEFLSNKKKYNLAIMAIFKNEEKYMEEWLDYHINQGVEHFYLYINDLNIDKYNYIFDKKYKHYVTLIPWVDKKNNGKYTVQRQAYTHCIKKYNNEYVFIMMLDLDEFIIHTNKSKKVIDFLNLIKDEWDTIKAIKVQRYDFGSNGYKKKPVGKVMDNFTKREKICSSYKTIANSDYIDINKPFYGVHDFNYLNKNGKIYNNYFSYKYTGYPNGCQKETENEIPLIINHYYTKSYEEYFDRCKLWENGGVNPIGFRKDCKKLFIERDKNDIDIADND